MGKQAFLSGLRNHATLIAVMLLHVVFSLIGIGWGLPDRSIDRYLFPDGNAWSGEKIQSLANAEQRFSPSVGADVDVDPLAHADEPVVVNTTDKQVAQILMRYRLYTYQPDEMITMMALSGMRPRAWQFDPRLYQYGGLFIYPVGALVGLGGAIGAIDVRSDLVYYLDHPAQFGRFYIVSRAYAALWGLPGILLVYLITRRICRTRAGDRTAMQATFGRAAGVVAAMLFTVLPVVVCMAHEGKPHLPGAVLMLAAVYAAMCLAEQTTSWRGFLWLGAACGAALGMVISAVPVMILLPVAAWQARREGWGRATARLGAGAGALAALAVYLLTNPYLLINAVTNREVLASNFGNSLAMYEIDRVFEGLVNVFRLMAEGATIPVLLIGLIGWTVLAVERNRAALPLGAVAFAFFVQFVLIGAGKPGEYGRFGVFPDTALAIACAVMLVGTARYRRWMPPVTAIVLLLATAAGLRYLAGFMADSGPRASRRVAAEALAALPDDAPLATPAEPAPYCFPPVDFTRQTVTLIRPLHGPSVDDGDRLPAEGITHIRPVDRRPTIPRAPDVPVTSRRQVIEGSPLGRWLPWRHDTPISWADKPFVLHRPTSVVDDQTE